MGYKLKEMGTSLPPLNCAIPSIYQPCKSHYQMRILTSHLCAQVLHDPLVPREVALNRAKALKKLGAIFQVSENTRIR